ncbi:hypothetical protein OIU76_011409 [Salix suchowensis]|nr:hypothetical protein OIU76_011409 [Salix suchowensis]
MNALFVHQNSNHPLVATRMNTANEKLYIQNLDDEHMEVCVELRSSFDCTGEKIRIFHGHGSVLKIIVRYALQLVIVTVPVPAGRARVIFIYNNSRPSNQAFHYANTMLIIFIQNKIVKFRKTDGYSEALEKMIPSNPHSISFGTGVVTPSS